MRIIEIYETTEYTIYCDLDGVLADFEKGITKLIGEPYKEDDFNGNKAYAKRMWKAVEKFSKEGGELWYNLDLMHDARQLWNYIKRYNAQILSATGHTVKKHTADQKRRWVADKLGTGVKVNLTQTAQEKSRYAKPNHILIDDKQKAINPWEAAGGVGILHTSAANTIKRLKGFGL